MENLLLDNRSRFWKKTQIIIAYNDSVDLSVLRQILIYFQLSCKTENVIAQRILERIPIISLFSDEISQRAQSDTKLSGKREKKDISKAYHAEFQTEILKNQ